MNGYVAYSRFGAAGDGMTDDLDALIRAHDYANENDLTVSADNGAVYYIGGADKTITIKTDTDWSGARFIIDDTNVKNRNSAVFSVMPKSKPFALTEIKTLGQHQLETGIALPCRCLVEAVDGNVRRYIRYGPNRNAGSLQTDIFLADADGRIDENTPVIWDFNSITSMRAFPVDDRTLTISGGHFTTVANAEESKYNYYARNIAITRSNVVVSGLTHTITGEKDHGAPYGGFIFIGCCSDIQIANCTFAGHKTYSTVGAAGSSVGMGSYDISIGKSVNVTFTGCRQTNDILDTAYWGVLGSNHCKNLRYENCILSRFDAHMGVFNATIENSTLGHQGINAIGSGVFRVENSTVYGGNVINLRSDYGSTWEGEFIIRNCRFVPYCGKGRDAVIIGGSNSGMHDFGYACHMPRRIEIDGLYIDDRGCGDGYTGPKIFGVFNSRYSDDSFKEDFPYAVTEEVTVSDLTSASGLPFSVSDNAYMFRNVKI